MADGPTSKYAVPDKQIGEATGNGIDESSQSRQNRISVAGSIGAIRFKNILKKRVQSRAKRQEEELKAEATASAIAKTFGLRLNLDAEEQGTPRNVTIMAEEGQTLSSPTSMTFRRRYRKFDSCCDRLGLGLVFDIFTMVSLLSYMILFPTVATFNPPVQVASFLVVVICLFEVHLLVDAIQSVHLCLHIKRKTEKDRSWTEYILGNISTSKQLRWLPFDICSAIPINIIYVSILGYEGYKKNCTTNVRWMYAILPYLFKCPKIFVIATNLKTRMTLPICRIWRKLISTRIGRCMRSTPSSG